MLAKALKRACTLEAFSKRTCDTFDAFRAFDWLRASEDLMTTHESVVVDLSRIFVDDERRASVEGFWRRWLQGLPLFALPYLS